MRIKWTTLYVDDQEKTLQFYTEKLGAVLDDTCGNLIQLTQLTWGQGA